MRLSGNVKRSFHNFWVSSVLIVLWSCQSISLRLAELGQRFDFPFEVALTTLALGILLAGVAVYFAALTHVGRTAETKRAALASAFLVDSARLHAVLEVVASVVVAAPGEALVIRFAKVRDDLASLITDATWDALAPRAAPTGELAILVKFADLPKGVWV